MPGQPPVLDEAPYPSEELKQHQHDMVGTPAAAAAADAATVDVAATGAAGDSDAGALASALAGLTLPKNSAAGKTARKTGQPLAVLGLTSLDEASLQGFYLADASLEQLADCCGGRHPPAAAQPGAGCAMPSAARPLCLAQGSHHCL